MNLNQVTVACSDVERSIDFYQKIGLKLIVHSRAHYARFVCPDGQSTFSVHQIDTQPRSTTTVYFECEALDAQVQLLKEKGIIFSIEPTDQSWLWREAHLTDPDGNRLILYRAGENRLNPPWKI